MDPVLKWAGSKRWAIPLLSRLYHPHRARRLVEPFVGGMAVALGLQPNRALLGDANPHLVNFHQHLQKGLQIRGELLNEEKYYYEQRDAFNGLIEAGCGHEPEIAALFYYLNRFGFNGLCRFNASGFFNVPFGKYKTVNYRRDFIEYVAALANWEIIRADFDTTLDRASADDFVYIDPPYDGTFTDYSAGGFSWEDQVRLALRVAAHPGPAVASNQATPRIAELYRDLGFKVDLMPAPRSISANGDREAAMEIFAVKNIDASTSTTLIVQPVANDLATVLQGVDSGDE